jgi:hypothetical protein
MPARLRPHFALLPALLLIPTGLRAETHTVPCRLPADAHLRFTFEQQGWGRDGAPWQISLTRALHLMRDGAGFSLTIDPASANGKLDGEAQRRMAMTYAPEGQQAMTVRLDMQGRIVGVDALDDHWRAYMGRVERLIDTAGADGESTQRSRSFVAGLNAADETARIRLLAGDIAGPLLRMCGQTVAAQTASDGALDVAEIMDAAALREQALYRVDASSGLTRSIERRVTPKAQPDRPLLMRWRFDPVL